MKIPVAPGCLSAGVFLYLGEYHMEKNEIYSGHQVANPVRIADGSSVSSYSD